MSRAGWFILSGLVVALDQWTKWLALTHLMSYTPYPVIPGFQLFLAFNTGAAFSFLSNTGYWHTLFFLIFSSVASLFLMVCLWRAKQNASLLNAAYSLILGGAIGNLIDRLYRSAVVDFIDVYFRTHHWPVFNIADSAICIGVVLFMLDWFENSKRSC